jgi:DNA-binding NarL/FixJ family response regulator
MPAEPAQKGRGALIRVLLAGTPPMRERVRTELTADGRILVVGEAATDAETIAVARRERPQVVVIDSANGVHPFATARRLLADPQLSATEVLMYGHFDREEYVLSAWRAGIGGLVSRNVSPADLVRAVRMSASGAAFVMPPAHRRR